ncbi:protein Bouncer [Silurus meridionalis]|uniref:protein Bouncer n=1 Tax=Silurus meridionalis TaxID=175797 RepID=UPI001EEC5042|nr:protein Bouncer [Silurus meridionalis]
MSEKAWLSSRSLLNYNYFALCVCVIFLPGMHCEKLLCYYCPMQLVYKPCRHVLTECLPGQQCFIANGHYGDYSGVFIKGCIPEDKCLKEDNHIIYGSLPPCLAEKNGSPSSPAEDVTLPSCLSVDIKTRNTLYAQIQGVGHPEGGPLLEQAGSGKAALTTRAPCIMGGVLQLAHPSRGWELRPNSRRGCVNGFQTLHCRVFQILRADCHMFSGKTKCGGISFYINSFWCIYVTVIHLFFINYMLFYLPYEFIH